MFLSCPAEVCIFGGAAGGGKTHAICQDPLKWIHLARYAAVFFRRTTKELKGDGSVWNTQKEFYPDLGGVPYVSELEWRFDDATYEDGRSGRATIRSSHLERMNDVFKHAGQNYTTIYWDELTHFLEFQFSFLFSRRRSFCGVRPYVRATTNPDPDSFVARLIAPWIDADGWPIPDMSGQIRWFARDGSDYVHAETREELIANDPDCDPMTLTFIPSLMTDNPTLPHADYRRALAQLPKEQRDRLEKGNWKTRAEGGEYFKRSYFDIIDEAPTGPDWLWCRAWDLAATKPTRENPDPDWTRGVLLARNRQDGRVVVAHVESMRETFGVVERSIDRIAAQDGRHVKVGLWQDPGAAGKAEAERHKLRLATKGFTSNPVRQTGDKISYAAPVSTLAEHGKVAIVRGPWNKGYIDELEGFPRGHDDQVDATSLAYLNLVRPTVGYA